MLGRVPIDIGRWNSFRLVITSTTLCKSHADHDAQPLCSKVLSQIQPHTTSFNTSLTFMAKDKRAPTEQDHYSLLLRISDSQNPRRLPLCALGAHSLAQGGGMGPACWLGFDYPLGRPHLAWRPPGEHAPSLTCANRQWHHVLSQSDITFKIDPKNIHVGTEVTTHDMWLKCIVDHLGGLLGP